MTGLNLTYLTIDSLTEGVGASQILPYVEGLADRGVDVLLHSFEKGEPAPRLEARLRRAGVRWHPHRFGLLGSAGGLTRVVRGAAALRTDRLVHVRSDLPAASALIARCPRWVWDMRGFWADERIDVGTMRRGSIEERVMRYIERKAARSAGGIVTLTSAAIPVLESRHGPEVGRKVRVVTTCVDLVRFPLSSLPGRDPIRLLICGTLSARYDVPLMVRIAGELGRRMPTVLEVLSPDARRWADVLSSTRATVASAEPEEMPERIASAHVGLSVLKPGSTVANRATAPTKLGEFLASGRPVVVNSSLGDMDELLSKFDCGVVVRENSQEEIERVAFELQRLLEDQLTPNRCRRLASEHFNLDQGVGELIGLYESVLATAC